MCETEVFSWKGGEKVNLFDIFKNEPRSEDTSGFVPQSIDDVLIRPNISLTVEDAMNIAAVDTSISFISGLIASMPIRLYKRDKDGVIEEITNDRRCYLLNNDTGDLLTPNEMKQAIVADTLMNGTGYCFINWRGNKVQSLHYVEQSIVGKVVSPDHIFKQASFIIDGKMYRDYQVLRLTRKTKNGATGIGLYEEHPLLLQAMYNALLYENKNLGSGTKKGFLKSAARLEDKVMEQLRVAWRKLTSSSDSEVMVLNNGIEFESAGTTAVENQLTENKTLNASEIYSIFGINDALFNAVSSSFDSYRMSIRTGVLPLVRRFESALNRILLLEKEKGEYFFKFDVDSVMQADTAERYKNYETAIKNSWLGIDDVRKKENLQPLGFNRLKLGLDAVLFDPKSGDIYVPNTGIGGNINDKTQEPNQEPTPNQELTPKGGEN